MKKFTLNKETMAFQLDEAAKQRIRYEFQKWKTHQWITNKYYKTVIGGYDGKKIKNNS